MAFVAVCLQDLCRQFSDDERDIELALGTVSCTRLAAWMLLIENTPRYISSARAQEISQAAWSLLVCSKSIKFGVESLRG